jgi:TRAP-type C4-dicarboxylate transport system permease small subunit
MEQPQQIPTPESNSMVKWVSRVMAAIGAATLGVMMLLSVADVIGRKFFLRPIEGTAELVGILLVIAASMGLGYCALIKGHIRISILFDRFSRRGQAAIDVFAYLVCVAAGVIITWQGSLRMYTYIFKQLGGRTAIVSLPLWPFMGVMVIGFAWLTVIMIIQLVTSIKEVMKR